MANQSNFSWIHLSVDYKCQHHGSKQWSDKKFPAFLLILWNWEGYLEKTRMQLNIKEEQLQSSFQQKIARVADLGELNLESQTWDIIDWDRKIIKQKENMRILITQDWK